jgi:hypothetical protein
MVVVELMDGAGQITTLPVGETVLGRGDSLGNSDKRLSRKQVCFYCLYYIIFGKREDEGRCGVRVSGCGSVRLVSDWFAAKFWCKIEQKKVCFMSGVSAGESTGKVQI